MRWKVNGSQLFWPCQRFAQANSIWAHQRLVTRVFFVVLSPFSISFRYNRCILGHWNPLNHLRNVSINGFRCERRFSSSTRLETWNQMDCKNCIFFVTIGLVRDSTTKQTNTTIDQSVHECIHFVGASTPDERIQEWFVKERSLGHRHCRCPISSECVDGEPSTRGHDATCTSTADRRAGAVDSPGGDPETHRSVVVSRGVFGAWSRTSRLSALTGARFCRAEGTNRHHSHLTN